jgi:hypothetical protein
MPKEWTDEEVQKEISEAVQIVREDRIDALIRSRLSAPPTNADDKSNNPPRSGNNSDPSATAKRKSLWWGTEE